MTDLSVPPPRVRRHAVPQTAALHAVPHASVPLRAWQDRLARMEARPDPLAGAARVLVVAAHPHDETLGAGRLIAGHAGPVVVLLAPWSRDPDADHRAAGRAAREAGNAAGVSVVEYPVWAPYFRTPHQVQETGQQLVPVESSVEAARAWRRALGQYLSQLQPWQPGWDPLVPADFVQHHLTQLVVEGEAYP